MALTNGMVAEWLEWHCLICVRCWQSLVQNPPGTYIYYRCICYDRCIRASITGCCRCSRYTETLLTSPFSVASVVSCNVLYVEASRENTHERAVCTKHTWKSIKHIVGWSTYSSISEQRLRRQIPKSPFLYTQVKYFIWLLLASVHAPMWLLFEWWAYEVRGFNTHWYPKL